MRRSRLVSWLGASSLALALLGAPAEAHGGWRNRPFYPSLHGRAYLHHHHMFGIRHFSPYPYDPFWGFPPPWPVIPYEDDTDRGRFERSRKQGDRAMDRGNLERAEEEYEKAFRVARGAWGEGSRQAQAAAEDLRRVRERRRVAAPPVAAADPGPPAASGEPGAAPSRMIEVFRAQGDRSMASGKPGLALRQYAHALSRAIAELGAEHAAVRELTGRLSEAQEAAAAAAP